MVRTIRGQARTVPMGEPDNDARELWRLLEPIHAVVYFSPEPLAALREAGYRGFWMGYFANRAAPLGPVGPEVVQALFYNFGWERVARALPAAWDFAPPAAALAARADGSVAALRRALGDLAEAPAVARAAETAMKAAVAAPLEGRALYAANHALPVPEEPLAQLWHAATLLREHRGDGHVATLVAAGIAGRQSHVFHAVATGTPSEVYTLARDFTEEEWDRELSGLRERGLVDADSLSEQGRQLFAQIEATTDRLAAPAYDVLSADDRAELLELLRPLAAAVVRTGDIPLDSPMGLDLRGYAPNP
jgi:hypothetical protein